MESVVLPIVEGVDVIPLSRVFDETDVAILWEMEDIVDNISVV